MTMKQTMNYSAIAGTAAMIILLAWMYVQGYFSDPQALQALLKQAGILAPLIFILIQIIQVVIPVIPGGISCGIGVLAFGPVWGFVYNYAGLIIGSAAAFLLARRYGKNFILKFTDQQKYDKYASKLDSGSKFDWFFASAIFLPLAPDDLLCMLAGLTKMSFKKFLLIILLGKPLSLLGYSMSLASAMMFIGA